MRSLRLSQKTSPVSGRTLDYRKARKNYDNARKTVDGLDKWNKLQYPPNVTKPVKPKQEWKGLMELYKHCEDVEPAWEEECKVSQPRTGTLGDLMAQCGGEVSVAPMKGKVRAMYKFIYKYSCDARQLTDVLRTSFIFDNLDNLSKGAKIINTHFNGGILNCKDRIFEPPASGYSDVLLNVRFNGIVCEIQLQLRAFYDEKKDSHKAYKVARHFGEEFEDICFGKKK